MPKKGKRARQALEAIRKRWKKTENSDELESEPVEYEVIDERQAEDPDEPSDAEPDEYDECFNTFWIEGEENRVDSEEITDQLQVLQQNALEQLVENAKKTGVWATSSRGQYIEVMLNQHCATRRHIGKRRCYGSH